MDSLRGDGSSLTTINALASPDTVAAGRDEATPDAGDGAVLRDFTISESHLERRPGEFSCWQRREQGRLVVSGTALAEALTAFTHLNVKSESCRTSTRRLRSPPSRLGGSRTRVTVTRSVAVTTTFGDRWLRRNLPMLSSPALSLRAVRPARPTG